MSCCVMSADGHHVVCRSGQAGVPHRLRQRDSGPYLGLDRGLAFGQALGGVEDLGGALAGDDHDPALVGHHHVAGADRDVTDQDRFTGRLLPQATACGHRYLSPGEDREAEVPGLAHVPAGAVGDDAPDGAHGGADAHDPAPRGHVGAACRWRPR